MLLLALPMNSIFLESDCHGPEVTLILDVNSIGLLGEKWNLVHGNLGEVHPLEVSLEFEFPVEVP